MKKTNKFYKRLARSSTAFKVVEKKLAHVELRGYRLRSILFPFLLYSLRDVSVRLA